MPKKLLAKEEIEKLIESCDPSVKFVERKKANCTSEWWQYYHHLFVNDSQQPFVSCNTCKSLLSFTSVNGTNSLRTLNVEYIQNDISDELKEDSKSLIDDTPISTPRIIFQAVPISSSDFSTRNPIPIPTPKFV
jgi:hypothetical protein